VILQFDVAICVLKIVASEAEAPALKKFLILNF